jgi:hypothetical protein
LLRREKLIAQHVEGGMFLLARDGGGAWVWGEGSAALLVRAIAAVQVAGVLELAMEVQSDELSLVLVMGEWKGENVLGRTEEVLERDIPFGGKGGEIGGLAFGRLIVPGAGGLMEAIVLPAFGQLFRGSVEGVGISLSVPIVKAGDAVRRWRLPGVGEGRAIEPLPAGLAGDDVVKNLILLLKGDAAVFVSGGVVAEHLELFAVRQRGEWLPAGLAVRHAEHFDGTGDGLGVFVEAALGDGLDIVEHLADGLGIRLS